MSDTACVKKRLIRFSFLTMTQFSYALECQLPLLLLFAIGKIRYLWQSVAQGPCRKSEAFASSSFFKATNKRLDCFALCNAGLQCLDSHLCHPPFHREHSSLWVASKILGLPPEAQPQASHQIAQNAGQYVWNKRQAPLLALSCFYAY